MSIEIVKFIASDGIILDGILNKCEEKTNKILIQIHGMISNCFKKRERTIAQKVEKMGIDTLCFNNRGSEVVRYIKSETESFLGGTAYEKIEDCYYDIVGAIEFALSLGYENIYLQGHSLGSTKVVYTYNRLKEENSKYLNNIKAIILLSLCDSSDTIEMNKDDNYLKIAEEKASNGELMDLMPLESYVHPISVRSYLQYARDYQSIDFARFDDDDYEFEVLNKIDVPLFMRWGNVNELIKRDAKDLAQFMNGKIHNPNKDISYIDGADHTYYEKEEQLGEEIKEFLRF